MTLSAPLLFVWSIVARDWRFLATSMLTCGIATTVATFQVSVYTSFLRAGAAMPRAISADFWIKARSVECFDFPTPFPEDYDATLARYFPQAKFRRVVIGFVPWRAPAGERANVALVGIDGEGIPETGFVADKSDLARLGLDGGRAEATIADRTLWLDRTVENLPTFLGAPYVLASFETARAVLRIDPTSTSFLAGTFSDANRHDLVRASAGADAAFPEVEIVSGHDFEATSSTYWQHKTGAGAAILLAAILACLLTAILLVNGVGRFIQRYDQDLLSLLAHGGRMADVEAVVAVVALIVTGAAMVIALALAPLLVTLAAPLLPWVGFRVADTWVPLGTGVLSLVAVFVSSRRAIRAYGPEAVFRS